MYVDKRMVLGVELMIGEGEGTVGQEKKKR